MMEEKGQKTNDGAQAHKQSVPFLNVYRSQSAKTPSEETLKVIATDLGFDIPNDKIGQYLDLVDGMLKECTILDDIPEPTLPVKFPRTPGYRPSQKENTHNAWFYKTNIKGAETGLLAGKRIAIKDNVPIAGVPMMAGSKLLEGFVPDFDATVVTRILEAGGTIIGKTCLEDMGMAASSFTSATGPIFNPCKKDHSAGGSSSGSAVVTAVGEADMAVGGDQGGSIRMPASWCGVVGMKPTYGLVPYTGILSMEPSLDHVGPLAKTVSDCALLLQVLSGFDDGLDPRQTKLPPVDYMTELNRDMSGVKIGLVQEGFHTCDEQVQKVVRKAIEGFLPSADIREISIPLHAKGRQIWQPASLIGTYKTTCMNHGLSSGQLGFYATSLGEYISRGVRTRANDLSETIKLACLYGEVLNRNYGSKYYSKSINLGRVLRKAYDEALESCDVLVMPTMIRTAPKLPPPDIDLKSYVMNATPWLGNTSPFNATGHPSLSINTGYIDGLPVGVMITGKHHHDAQVLSVAFTFEQARDTANPMQE